MPQFDNVEILSNDTYGVGDFDSSYVPETEQPQTGEETDEDEEVAVDEEDDIDFDNYVFDTHLDDEETRRESYFVTSFPGNDDFHDMPSPSDRRACQHTQPTHSSQPLWKSKRSTGVSFETRNGTRPRLEVS